MTRLVTPRTLTILALIVIATFSRLLPHPPNFTALGAVALFGGAVLQDRRLALILPLATLWLSDLLVNNVIYSEFYGGQFIWMHPSAIGSYVAYALIALLGHSDRIGGRAGRVLAASLGAAVIFFVLSNLGVWLAGGLYPLTIQGLTACFIAAIPFFGYSLAAYVFFSAVLFGAMHGLERRYQSLAA